MCERRVSGSRGSPGATGCPCSWRYKTRNISSVNMERLQPIRIVSDVGCKVAGRMHEVRRSDHAPRCRVRLERVAQWERLRAERVVRSSWDSAEDHVVGTALDSSGVNTRYRDTLCLGERGKMRGKIIRPARVVFAHVVGSLARVWRRREDRRLYDCTTVPGVSWLLCQGMARPRHWRDYIQKGVSDEN